MEGGADEILDQRSKIVLSHHEAINPRLLR